MNNTRRDNTVNILAMYFLELGYVPTWFEYKRSRSVPLKVASVLNVFRDWNQAIATVYKLRPDVLAELEAPKVAPKVAPKPAPKVTAKKPVVKVASKKEK